MLSRRINRVSKVVLRSFGGGKEFDPKYERDWNEPRNKMLYDYYLKDYDEGFDARTGSVADRKLTVQSFLTKYLSDSQKSMVIKVSPLKSFYKKKQAAAQNFDNRKAERAVLDETNLPKLHENSLNVYMGGDIANQAVNLRTYDQFPILGPGLLFPVPAMGYFVATWVWFTWARVIFFI